MVAHGADGLRGQPRWRPSWCPALTDETAWPYLAVGVGFAALGVAFVGYGFHRMRQVDAALAKGEFERPDARVLALLAAVGVILGFALLAIVAFGG